MDNITSYYVSLLVVVSLLAVGGYDETLKLVRYIELRIKTIWIDYRLHQMKTKLKRELDEWKSSREL